MVLNKATQWCILFSAPICDPERLTNFMTCIHTNCMARLAGGEVTDQLFQCALQNCAVEYSLLIQTGGQDCIICMRDTALHLLYRLTFLCILSNTIYISD